MSPGRAASTTFPRHASAGGAGGAAPGAHSSWRFPAVYAAFVLAFAALRPAFLAREPNPFPVLGNGIYYSFPEVMEAAYFTTSFVAFIALVLILTRAGILHTRPTVLPATAPVIAAGHRDRLRIALIVALPWIVLLLPQGPPVLVADAFHHGEKLIFQGRPFTEAYRSFFPFKPLIFMKVAGLAGHDNSVASYVAVREIVQRVGYVAVCLLITLVVRLLRGRYSMAPVLVFLFAYPLLADALRYRYWILDMERLLFFLLFLSAVVLHLIHGRRWPLVFAGAFVAIQFLASVEYAIFAACALAVHLALLGLRDRREGLWAGAASAAGALPVVGALLATGQLLPLLRFVSYTTRFPSLYGTPLLYAASEPAPGAASTPFLLPLVAVWLALLWAAGVFVPRALIRRQLDDRSLWITMVLVLSILMFKVGLGRSDVQHLYVPLLFSMLFLLTLALARPQRLPRAPRIVPAVALVAGLAFVAVAGFRVPPVPPGFVYDGSSRIRAHIPAQLSSELSTLRALLAGTRSRSLFFFSDQPLYSYLLDLRYELRNPAIHEILTDDMLARETDSFRAWAPDLVAWNANSWSTFVDKIRTPVRDYRMAAAILARYRPLVARDGWVFLVRDGAKVDRGALRERGFTPIDDSTLEETFDWRDMAYHIGRSRFAPSDFKRFALTLPSDACCVYRQRGRRLIAFAGKAGTHTYALYPGMAPGYRETAWNPDSISCQTCDEASRAATP